MVNKAWTNEVKVSSGNLGSFCPRASIARLTARATGVIESN
jgi:hypothetical protein